jgi:hypothetical protein
MKNKIILTFLLLVFVQANTLLANNLSTKGDEPHIKQFENPISYENKKETTFKVFQVISTESAALAIERDDIFDKSYNGKVVLIVGDGPFYDSKIVKVKMPMMVGTFTYLSKGGSDKTVPIIMWFTKEE